MKKRLLFVVNTIDFFLSHRLPIALSAQNAGYEVHVATGTDDGEKQLKVYGFKHHPLPLTRSGKNVLREIWTTLLLTKMMRKLKPDIVHLVTIKPVIYGGIAARISGMPAVVAAISGLGATFLAQSTSARILRFFVTRLYRLALGHKNINIIFQNDDDRKLLLTTCRLMGKKTTLIPGSGVALSEYPNHPEPKTTLKVIFAARLLEDKGIREFVEAAYSLNQQGVKAEFQVAGTIDPGNPTTITEPYLNEWRNSGAVEFLGQRNDIARLFSMSHIVVLPSYREGLPKVLIEAAACGRAVVTTDVPGCRDAIIPDVTGILVPPRNSGALAYAIKMLSNNPVLRQEMGRAGRALAEKKFAIENVIETHMSIYDELLKYSPEQ